TCRSRSGTRWPPQDQRVNQLAAAPSTLGQLAPVNVFPSTILGRSHPAGLGDAARREAHVEATGSVRPAALQRHAPAPGWFASQTSTTRGFARRGRGEATRNERACPIPSDRGRATRPAARATARNPPRRPGRGATGIRPALQRVALHAIHVQREGVVGRDAGT